MHLFSIYQFVLSVECFLGLDRPDFYIRDAATLDYSAVYNCTTDGAANYDFVCLCVSGRPEMGRCHNVFLAARRCSTTTTTTSTTTTTTTTESTTTVQAVSIDDAAVPYSNRADLQEDLSVRHSYQSSEILSTQLLFHCNTICIFPLKNVSTCARPYATKKAGALHLFLFG